mmetsp:Transcript_1660/g.6015  ORF Transcript_1660/g.6015 Transcript_1660/m.6015 type:complete len:339 (+) Transcript_1660:307-1323(+)
MLSSAVNKRSLTKSTNVSSSTPFAPHLILLSRGNSLRHPSVSSSTRSARASLGASSCKTPATPPAGTALSSHAIGAPAKAAANARPPLGVVSGPSIKVTRPAPVLASKVTRNSVPTRIVSSEPAGPPTPSNRHGARPLRTPSSSLALCAFFALARNRTWLALRNREGVASMFTPPNDLKLTVASAAASCASRMASSSSCKRSRSSLMVNRRLFICAILLSLATSARRAAAIAARLFANASKTCSFVADADFAASARFELAARCALSLMMCPFAVEIASAAIAREFAILATLFSKISPWKLKPSATSCSVSKRCCANLSFAASWHSFFKALPARRSSLA